MKSLKTHTIQKDDRKTINAWAMYDWANSVFALVITSAIFPAYYNTVTRIDGSSKVNFLGMELENTAIYSICLGISFGTIALISPLLSSVADYTGRHKTFMKFFCYLGATACSALFFFDGSNLYFGLGALSLASIGYAGSIVYYNSYLPAIASEQRQDRTSAKGYAFGYIGASTLLIINLVAILNQELLGVKDDTLLPRISFLLSGLWWFGFAQLTFARLPRGIYKKRPQGHFLFNGYQELVKIWHRLGHERKLKSFLASFFFYIMGVQTVMFMAASFGEKEIQLNITQLIIIVLSSEYLGIVGAFLFAGISKRIGNVPALILAVCVWLGICFGAYFIESALHFYVIAFFIGLVMGGIQSLSRSTYSKLIPKTENNAGYFSFYDVCEKTAMMFGLVMFGYLDNLFGSMRYSIVALGVWFFIGLIFLIRTARIRQTSLG